MINIVIFIVLTSVISILFANTRLKGIIGVSTVIVIGILSSFYGVKALLGETLDILIAGPALFGNVPIRIDALSGWFILLINFTLITGALYGINYMKKYSDRKSDITMHCIAYIFVQFALLGICSIQNGFILLLLWELMALSTFILIIFEHEKSDTIKAGINYLVQSHLSIVFIMLGFLYVAYKTGNYGFDDVAAFSKLQSPLEGTALFLCFFIGFAIKAGFVPFHTWLPYAHPAAPSHVSGMRLAGRNRARRRARSPSTPTVTSRGSSPSAWFQLPELAMGVISRAAPAINLMAVGMPLRLIVGLLVIAMAIPAAPRVIARFETVAADISLRVARSFR